MFNRIIMTGAVLWMFVAFGQDVKVSTPETPEKMAADLGIQLPKRPWHMADIYYELKDVTPHFDSLSVDVTIDRDIPSGICLYISPCGCNQINGMQFYGGFQTAVLGWPSKENHQRVGIGHGAIFSRWSNDKKTKIGLENVRMIDGGLCESAGYEGEFCSVRRPLAWHKGTYTYSIIRGDSEAGPTGTNTWFHCIVRDHAHDTLHSIGSLRFEGTDFTFWKYQTAFVEIYATGRIKTSPIPEVTVTFGYPRINGKKPALKKATVNYNRTGRIASPPCAKARAEGENVVIDIGRIFKPEPDDGTQTLPLQIEK